MFQENISCESIDKEKVKNISSELLESFGWQLTGKEDII